MQPNTARFQQFNDVVRFILPQIQHVSVRPSPTNRERDEISARIDLALPLSQCGTGIGQVLAILYVVLNQIGVTIIIDEPQSFLHPGATRKLVEFLRTQTKQQIIIATHSATVINSAAPRTITVTKQKDGETQFEQLDARQTVTLELCLADIGAKLGDVFGADNILWVEGATEVLCFPPILEKLNGRPLMGTAIVGVRRMGDFDSKDAKRVLEIHRDLCKSGSLIPPAVGFIFDRDCRSHQQMEELNNLGNGRVRFLPRQMYENYLLSPMALCAVVNQLAGSARRVFLKMRSKPLSTNGARTRLTSAFKSYPQMKPTVFKKSRVRVFWRDSSKLSQRPECLTTR
jgi:AAA domain, putative AbiEii toxin, Type IV TA system